MASNGFLRRQKGFETTVFSIVVVVYTFGSKAVRVSMRLSNLVNNGIRGRLSSYFRRLIERSIGQSLCALLDSDQQKTSFLKTHLVMRPLLALYITGHIYVTYFTSMTAEVRKHHKIHENSD
jgi:hypothetical protein